MLIVLLLAAQVVTSTDTPPARLRTELEHALWLDRVRWKTRALDAESKVRQRDLEAEASARARRLEVRTATLTCAPQLICPPAAADERPSWGTVGVCAAAAAGALVGGVFLGQRTCGPIVVGVP